MLSPGVPAELELGLELVARVCCNELGLPKKGDSDLEASHCWSGPMSPASSFHPVRHHRDHGKTQVFRLLFLLYLIFILWGYVFIYLQG